MSFIFEQRASDSPLVESITRGHTAGSGTVVRPAECCWHMVLLRNDQGVRLVLVGPWTTSGEVGFVEGTELLWIKFKLGTFMPRLPTRAFIDSETDLPRTSRDTFWLHGQAWPLPDFENAELFVDRLARSELLARDPIVAAALREQERPEAVPPRTLRHRFLRATGLSQSHIRQFERAQHAASMLRHGAPIADAMFEAGYFDQPHLTRHLKRFTGITPGQFRSPSYAPA